VDVGATFIAYRQAAIAIEPGEGAFDDPAMTAQALTRFDAASSDPRNNATLAAGASAAWIVVALVCMQFHRTATWAATTSLRLTKWGNRIKGDFQEPGIVDVGGGEDDSERDACAVDDHMALRSRFSAIRGIGPRLLAPLLAGTLAESRQARDQSICSASAKRCSNL
jgi:hypothetical protein